MQRMKRLKREYENLEQNEQVSCRPTNDNMDTFRAIIMGPSETPYSGRIYEILLNIPEKYPYEPPRVNFITPIYHPNIDPTGRICMDLLNIPPKGSWTPVIGLRNILQSIMCLLMNPNPDDPLMPEIAQEFKYNRELFERKARMLEPEKNGTWGDDPGVRRLI
ncbi:ubiquitin-conjugating enzyme E2 T-like [Ceratina calcarata]|uniref:Ubiquitin-conjugating enzyme E2 T-like n=1 Tax=Ceratina calcarata TaxID=156304 RepID=A0AAJ7NF13_9HYME|nr:ubiquitin-conjugating enzyme E2 T-like [Ceratina calcarata]